MSGHVRVEVDGGVGTLTLDRAEKLNALVGVMRDSIAEGLERLGGDDSVRAVIVTGAGRAFCAGADIDYLDQLMEGDREEEFARLVDAGSRVVHAVIDMPKPVICALNGPAAGGGANLALSCDLRIASERASIGQTFNRIGLLPDWGGTYLVPRLVGHARAAELFFLADMVDAHEAERIGLVNRVVPHDRLAGEARALAERLAAKPALPLRLAKEALRRSLRSDLDAMLRFELESQLRCFRSADAREGVAAFLEKREARFGRSGDEEPGKATTEEAGEAPAEEARGEGAA